MRKGYTYFAEGDVLFAKITPCMQNGKHAVATGLHGGFGFGSTEFHVIRPGPSVTPEWVHHFVMQPWVLQDATAHFTGAVGQQRVPENYLRELQVPLPPLPEQRRIAVVLQTHLAAVGRARAAAEAQLQAARALPAAYLRAVFDGPEAQQWPRRRMGDVLRLRKEVVHPRDRPSGPATFVGLEHIESHTGRRIGSLPVEMSDLTGRKPVFYAGDIVYGYLRPYLNKVWIAEFDGLCSVDQYVYTVDTSTSDRRFVSWFMRSPVYLERAAAGAAPAWLPRIRIEEVGATEVNLPPLSEQRRMAAMIDDHMATVDRLRQALEEQLDALDGLPAALLQQAFSGMV